MKKITFNVPNINCGNCIHSVEMELGEVDGVTDVKASSDMKKVEVEFGEPATEQLLLNTLAAINFPANV